MQTVSLIVAKANNNVIGVNGTLPWRLSADLQYFKRTTMGKPIIMGRKTFDSIGKPLPGRTNIVLTRDQSFSADGVHTASTPEQALLFAHQEHEEAMIIGGAQIYAAFFPLATRLYLTEVDCNIEGDTFFVPVDTNVWQTTFSEAHCKDEKNQYDYRLVVLEKKE